MEMNTKKDMSSKCGFRYFEYWRKALGDMTMGENEFYTWYNANCGQCKFMGEVCMYDECKERETKDTSMHRVDWDEVPHPGGFH